MSTKTVDEFSRRVYRAGSSDGYERLLDDLNSKLASKDARIGELEEDLKRHGDCEAKSYECIEKIESLEAQVKVLENAAIKIAGVSQFDSMDQEYKSGESRIAIRTLADLAELRAGMKGKDEDVQTPKT